MDIRDAFNKIKTEMEKDSEVSGSLAHAWHCNIAMSCYDAMDNDVVGCSEGIQMNIANDAASRFMKKCFDVVTKR